jgi:hypothetical protein
VLRDPNADALRGQNGRVWDALGRDCRAAYIQGMLQGWDLRANTEEFISERSLVPLAWAVSSRPPTCPTW